MFQLPCNTNVPAEDITCLAGVTQAAYEVWSRALGNRAVPPHMTTCAVDPVTQEEICSTENVLLVRNKGKSTFTNVTERTHFSGCRYDGDGDLERVALFSGGLEDFMWQSPTKG